ncbi:hypothetical protein ACHAXT_000574 [Thalassiosira profunda]
MVGRRVLAAFLLASCADIIRGDPDARGLRGDGADSSTRKVNDACLTPETCKAASRSMGLDSFIVGNFPATAKGCFAKNGRAYFSLGGSPEQMSTVRLAGVQKRIWCTADDALTAESIDQAPGDAAPTRNSDYTVGVYYYPWHGPDFHFGEGYVRNQLQPPQMAALGEYDDTNPGVIRQHLQWSRSANINLWVTSWWGPGKRTDTTLENSIMTHPDLPGTSVAIFYETLSRLQAKRNYTAIDNAYTDVAYMANKYFGDANYYRIEGRPVVFMYLTRVLSADDRLGEVIGLMRAAAMENGGHDLYIIGDQAFGAAPANGRSYEPFALLDGVTGYDVYGALSRPDGYAGRGRVRSLLANNKAWKARANQGGTSYIPCVSPGYNDRGVRFDAGHTALSRKLDAGAPEGSLFQASLQGALGLADSSTGGLIMINSWNEWHEDTQIEPTVEVVPGNGATNEPLNMTCYGGACAQSLSYRAYGSLYLNILKAATERRPANKQLKYVGNNGRPQNRDDDGDESTHSNRVPKTLYRQLLSWCRKYDDVPFNPLPPVTLQPPQVNPVALKRLKGMRTFLNANEIEDSPCEDMGQTHPAHFALHNEDVAVKENMIIFPEIRDANELRAVIRAVYWLNNESTIAGIEGDDAKPTQKEGDTKEQITLAFEAIKSCNELSSTDLESKRSRRQLSIEVRQGGGDYPSIEYHVGQVVQHKSKKWRGVVVGWTLKPDNNEGRLSSLTTKQYSLPQEDAKEEEDAPNTQKKLQYTILVDLNDAQGDVVDEVEGVIFGKSVTLESQEELVPVDDAHLQRIYNSVLDQYFTRFQRGHYVPNRILSYMYPLDRYSEGEYGVDTASDKDERDENATAEIDKSQEAILKGVEEIGRRLLVPLSDNDKEMAGSSSLISSLASSVQSMASANKPLTVVSSLADFQHLLVKINALLWTRKANKGHNNINFSLGQTVKHKKYGFRGVVVAWDPKPKFDVSNWDGLQGIENPQEKPFYHIHPDVNDCVRAFGGPRHSRYVCQDNLSPYDETQPLQFEMDLDSEQFKWDAAQGRYLPSEEMKFMYGEGLGEQEANIVSTLRSLRVVLADCLLGIRDGDRDGLFSMNDLFLQLQAKVESFEDSLIVQDLIKEIWKEHANPDLRNELDDGIAALMEGNVKEALATFSAIIEADPMHAEAWNKKATVLYLLGEKDASLEAAAEALKIEPRQFQAMAGAGLIHMDSGDPKAIETFRRCLDINPWLVMQKTYYACL